MSQLPMDLPLLGGLLLLSGIAMVVLYSASGQSLDVVLRQGLRLMLALFVMVGVAMIHPRQLANMSPILYLVGALMLALVLLFGKISMGAQRWLDLGIIRFQPSELTKLSTPMMIAWFMARYTPPPAVKRLFGAALLILLPVLLIAKQPDLGTAILVGSSGAAVIFLSGISFKILAGLFVLGAGSLPLFWQFLQLAFIAQVQELIQLPFIISLSTFVIGLLPFFLKVRAFS